MIHEISVRPGGDDPDGRAIQAEAAGLGIIIDPPITEKVYRLEGITDEEAERLTRELLVDPVSERSAEPASGGATIDIEVGYKPGVMNPAALSLLKAARDMGIKPEAVDVSRRFGFRPEDQHLIGSVVTGFLMNKKVQEVVKEVPKTLIFEGEIGPVNTVPIREATADELRELSRDRLFLNDEEMSVMQEYFRELNREPTDAELEIIAARWSEHCGHKTFNAIVKVDGVRKAPLFDRIKTEAKRHFSDKVLSAFKDNSGVIRFYDGWALAGKVETHNSPSAVEPYGGAMTGSGGVFRDIAGTGQGAKNILSTDMFCLAPPDTDPETLPPGTLRPGYLLRRVIQGVSDYGNRMGIPTANGSLHFHPDFRAKPSVIVGAYGILPESRAGKGEPQVDDSVVIIGGRTGRDGINGATFSSGEMTERTAIVNSNAVQIGNAIEEKRMFDALLEARDNYLVRAITDCGAAGFSSAVGEMAEHIGVTVDIAKAPLKYAGLAPWEIWLSESQERMVLAVSPNNLARFLEICKKYNVEATDIGEFDGSHTLTVNYGEQKVAELEYDFLNNGLPQRVMEAHWEPEDIPEVQPSYPSNAQEWVIRFKAVLAHGNVCSKEPIVRQYDHGVQGGNIVSPFGGINQNGPNDALVVRPLLDKPYGMVQSHGMNPILTRLNPYDGTIWAFAEAAANYVSAGGKLAGAAAVGNYIWPFPDKKAMGSLDMSVDAAVKMMEVLEVPVISGKDSLSSTYRGAGIVIEIPPVYAVSLFGPIPDVEKTMTTDIKKPGESILYLVGQPDKGMGGSAYYDIAEGSSAKGPKIDLELLPRTLSSIERLVEKGGILSCHDVSEGGVITAVTEMCIGGNAGAKIRPADRLLPYVARADEALFNETAGCFVIEVEPGFNALRAFSNHTPFTYLGTTTTERSLTVIDNNTQNTIFEVPMTELEEAWQAPMKGIF